MSSSQSTQPVYPERSMRHEAGCHQVETGNPLSCAHLKVRQPGQPERSMRHEAGCHQVETGTTRKVNEA